MKDDILIKIEGVSKKFCRNLKKSLWYGLLDVAGETLGLAYGHDQLRSEEFWAVQNVSFELSRGECLGLLGRNGAGKTTLLKLINGLIKPDKGKIEITGRMGALIALGAGFHPLLTGRENIYVNASILGIGKRETDKKFDEIVDFAELKDFIDMPVQSYSSGMQVRLGFAIAAVLIQPDVLLLDEVLAVGDMGFKIKCLNAVRQIMSKTAVIFVSHSMQFVSQFCNRIAVLNQGSLVCDTTDIGRGIDVYLAQFPTELESAGTGDAVIEDVKLRSVGKTWTGQEEAFIHQGEDLEITCIVKILTNDCRNARFTVQIMDQFMEPVIFLLPQTTYAVVAPGTYQVKINLNALDLNAGKYSLVLSLEDEDTRIRLIRLQGVGKFRVIANLVHWARIVRKTDIMIERI